MARLLTYAAIGVWRSVSSSIAAPTSISSLTLGPKRHITDTNGDVTFIAVGLLTKLITRKN